MGQGLGLAEVLKQSLDIYSRGHKLRPGRGLYKLGLKTRGPSVGAFN